MSGRTVTELLQAHRSGQSGALDDAFGVVYEELRKLARYHLRGHGRTLDTTSLVHEVYLRFSSSGELAVEDRSHFMNLSSRAMRQVIVDDARARRAGKRGGDAVRVSLDTGRLLVDDHAEWILTIDEALAQVRAIDERLERVFECRFFAGLSEEETAAALGVSARTVQRDWQRARAWLREVLSADTGK